MTNETLAERAKEALDGFPHFEEEKREALNIIREQDALIRKLVKALDAMDKWGFTLHKEGQDAIEAAQAAGYGKEG